MEVASALARSSVSPDWREAVRRIPLMRVLSNELAVPQLIEALSLWHERGLGGASSRRVEALLVEELELRSKKHLGLAPERWTYWWKVQRANPTAADPKAAGQESEAQTQAAFFGLHPWTDRVVFVIDRSGSMAGPFGTDRASRYTEALRQLAMFLQQLGPRTHFNLVLFSDAPHAWSTCLKPARPAMISSALEWARNAPPQGGTMLRPAVTGVLELDPRTGLPDLKKLEADTVIVLCDGGTAEGAAWVSPLMRAVRESACLRFDCVQIGNSGDGTLEALALESGGQFVQIDP
ncbi:MAG TPA: VWA domain-containing protein [Planctomycetota bacterium]|nr:VWA domain-containing protein [Planctomycetota bacterium]